MLLNQVTKKLKKYIKNKYKDIISYYYIMEINKQITLEEYLKEVEQQNKFILEQMLKNINNSKIYELRRVQYQTNLLNIETNKKLGYVLVGQSIE